MVHLNKNKLSEQKLNDLFHKMSLVLGKLSGSQSESFLSDLLGKEERIMLVKRLAILILLLEGKSLYSIGNILKVSPSTAENIANKLKTGQYDTVISVLKKNKREYLSILKTIDNILHLGGVLPHRVGLERYKHL